MNIQNRVGVRFRRVESDALDRARRLHGIWYLFCICCAEIIWHRHFRPGASSTPYHGGEQHEMPTVQHEQSGLPSYDETTPLITDDEIQKRLDILRYNRDTGLLDTTKMADTSVNPLSEEDKQLQIN